MVNTDAGTVSVHSRYDWSNTAPSIAVIDAIAALEDVEPIDLSKALDTILFDHVDPEALDTILADDGHVTVSFTISGYRVRFDGNELEITCR